MSKIKTVIAGNWKMNKSLAEVELFIDHLDSEHWPIDRVVIIGCPFPMLHFMAKKIDQYNLPMAVAAQNCHQEQSGAYTGEVSVEMIKSVGAKYVILGHSERRQYFGENDELIKEKIRAALEIGLKVIYCCGEKLAERENGTFKAVVSQQIEVALSELRQEDWVNLMIAYEPVWAIGTGRVASPSQAEEMHAHIRNILPDAGQETPILYGGSMKPNNAKELLAEENVNGGLIGGASLDAESFLVLIKVYKKERII